MSSSVINFPPDRLQKIENRFKNAGFKVGIIPALINPSKEKEPNDLELQELARVLNEKQPLQERLQQNVDTFSVYNNRCEIVTYFVQIGKCVNFKI